MSDTPSPAVPGESEERQNPHRLVDKWTGEPCPTRGKLLCTIPWTVDGEHRHTSAHVYESARSPL